MSKEIKMSEESKQQQNEYNNKVDENLQNGDNLRDAQAKAFDEMFNQNKDEEE